MRATVWFDGACPGNPGPMGAGAIVEAGSKREVLARNMGRGTNNQAEYHGLLLGLRRALEMGATEATVHGDSELVVKQVRGDYKVRKAELKPLHAEAQALLARFAEATVEWVPRAANAEADAAANAALRQPPQMPA